MFEPDQHPFQGYHFDDPKLVWRLLSQFNFDDRGLTINFSPYDVLPFAFGSHEVPVPWRVVETFLRDDYRQLPEWLRVPVR